MKDPTINDNKLSEIIQQCKNRMDVSYYKYGAARDNFASGRVDAVRSLRLCLEAYMGTRNTEYLLGVINCAAYRIMWPAPGDYFRATDSAESAGTDGVPINFERE